MGIEDVEDCSAPHVIGISGEMDNGSNSNQLVFEAERLSRVELDLACCSEKLVNLGILVMYLGLRENDYKAFTQHEEDVLETHVEKALEFDFLYGYLDCEIQELEISLCALQSEIAGSSMVVSSSEHLGDAFKEMEYKIKGCTDCLNQTLQQVVDLKEQCVYFKRILLASPESTQVGKDEGEPSGLQNGDLPESDEQIKMQTAEQQKNVLRMLEKSLAREMDLEKKFTESRQMEEDLKAQLQQQANCMELEVEILSGKLFDAENTKEVIFGFLKEFQEKFTEVERGAENAESKFESLKAANLALYNDLNHIKDELSAVRGKSQQLETQLTTTENHLVHAVAFAEACREMQIMSDQTIKDMDLLIQDLKSKVSRAENETECAEDKCILLSETNAELTEVIDHLRSRVEDLETSLCRANEVKKQYGGDIRVRIKLIVDLILKLANEREHLHHEVLSLRKEKKLAVKNLKQQIKVPSLSEVEKHDSDIGKTQVIYNNGNDTTSTSEITEETTCSSTKKQSSDSTPPETGTRVSSLDSKVDTVGDISAKQFTSIKHFIRAVLLLGIPVFLISHFLSLMS